MPLLELKNVSKSYRQGGVWGKRREVRAVRRADIALEAGRCLAVVGASGSGKSTLGRLALGLERPDGGEILYRGEPLHRGLSWVNSSVRRDLQVVFQNSQGAVNPRFTARDIIGEPLVNFFSLRGGALSDKVAELLTSVGLSPDEMDKLPHQFSGGELQRICLARALAPKPALIVLDEAVSSLDMLNQSRILDLLDAVKHDTGTAFLFISHDMRVVCRLADAVTVMADGESVCTFDNLPGTDAIPPDHPALRRLADAILPEFPR